MPAKKNGTSGTKKTGTKKPAGKTAPKKRTAAKAAPKKKKTVKKTAQKGRIDRTPVYVLLIMVLLTAVVLLVNHYVFDTGVKKTPAYKTDIRGNGKTAADKQAPERKADVIPEEKIISEKVPAGKTSLEKTAVDFADYNIYLVKFNKIDESMSLFPVKRRVSAKSPLAETLNELIRGPSRSEKKRGLLTAVPEDLKIRSLSVTGRNAVLDLNDSIEENANGQILLTRIDQLVYTVTQFEGIDGVIIKVNGKERKFLGGEGLSVSGPIRRR